jgi:hypothetical protein
VGVVTAPAAQTAKVRVCTQCLQYLQATHDDEEFLDAVAVRPALAGSGATASAGSDSDDAQGSNVEANSHFDPDLDPAYDSDYDLASNT